MKAKYLVLLSALIILNFHLNAQGDLLITPKRVVFEGLKQKEEISLVNIGKDSATYSISFLQKNMHEDGSFVTVVNPDEAQMAVDPFMRIFPRRVTLAPGEAQLIMLQCRRKPDMKAGEYRSHLYFRAEKNNTPLGMTNTKNDSTQVSVKLVPVFGVSIPVIIRSGDISVISAISNVKIESGENSAKIYLTLSRTGNISTYGDIKVEFVPERGKSVVVGTLKGIGVYTSIDKRNISFDLNNNQGIPLKNGKLKVLFTSQDGSRYEVFAESQISL